MFKNTIKIHTKSQQYTHIRSFIYAIKSNQISVNCAQLSNIRTFGFVRQLISIWDHRNISFLSFCSARRRSAWGHSKRIRVEFLPWGLWQFDNLQMIQRRTWCRHQCYHSLWSRESLSLSPVILCDSYDAVVN